MNFAALSGRILLSSIFVASGIVKLVSTEAVRDVLVAHYLSASDAVGTALVIGSGLLELAGAALVILGLRTRLGVILLVLALIPATFLYHFAMGDEDQLVHFLKNASILGGLVLVWAFGPGELSLDAQRSRDRKS